MEALLIELLDELRERSLPPLLTVIVERSELGRIHPELAGHLHVRVGEAVSLAGDDPVLQLLVELHWSRYHGPYTRSTALAR